MTNVVREEDRKSYLNLIEIIIQNIKDIDTLKRIYSYTQALWYEEQIEDPGG